MTKLLKFLKALKAKGFATAEEKTQLTTMFKALEGEDAEAAETVAEEVADAEKLPEADPAATADDAEIEKGIKALFASHAKALEAGNAAKLAEFVETAKAEVKAWVDAQKAEASKKAGLYHPDVQEKRKGLNSYLRAFTRATLAGDVAELQKLNNFTTVKELTTDGTGSPYGGYVVDRELSAEIRHLTTEYGVARREMTAIQLTKNSYDANTLVTDVTVYWVAEAAAIKSTQVVLGQKSLSLKKLGAIVTLTRELLEDEEIDLFSFIAGRVAEGFARYEDRAFFMGEGAGDTANAEFTGAVFAATGEVIIPVRGSNDGESFLHMTADDLLDMQDEAPQSIATTGKYYMHRSIRNIVRKLKDEQGNYIYQAPSEGGPATIWGRPVVEVEVMPGVADDAAETAFVLYGDMKKAMILGYKGAISADRFNAGTVRNVADNADINLITTDREAIRWIERVGAMAILPSTLVALKTGGGS